MLDLLELRQFPHRVAQQLERRGIQCKVEEFLQIDLQRKALQIEVERLQAEKNKQAKAYQKDNDAANELLQQANHLIGERLAAVQAEFSGVQNRLDAWLLNIPNIPDETVPTGKSEADNQEIRRWGCPPSFKFPIKDHVTLGNLHKGFEWEQAAKISGSRFVVMQGEIASLHRALGQFMVDLHTQKHGYQEAYVPYLVHHEALRGTGQLPKLSQDLFHVLPLHEGGPAYGLIPTTEVPLTNLVYDKVLRINELPLRWVAHTPCFRSEAGSYGRDTRGLIRMHQFDKVELVQIVLPEESNAALEALTGHAEAVLQALQLPYRVMLLCSGDMGFSAAKTYDLEVWIPSQQQYREISSCSNMRDFQARRLRGRFRAAVEQKPRYVHTLNGSGLAVGRTLVAILENFQQGDGRILIPKVLRSYLQGKEYIGAAQ